MFLRSAVWFVLLFAPLAHAEAPALLIWGDSLSAGYGMDSRSGWVAQLAERLRRGGYPQRVVNASVSGETTAGGLARLPQALATHAPAIVIIELGGNDGLRGLPLKAIRANLAGMIEAAQVRSARVLLIGMRLPPNYGASYTRGFHDIYRGLAHAYGVPLVPFLLEGVAGDRRLMQSDGIHAAAEAQDELLDNVWPHLLPLLRLEDAAAAEAPESTTPRHLNPVRTNS